ncbi:MAG: type II toxin-antitoxin system HicB family antitoxin [Bacteroidia bacterium]|nr:type II toxin-antitoxin system HicB family antitoxin [Bacteroidia bacterium]
MKKMELTMMVENGENGYFVGQIVEYPAALSQGKTIEELESNLKDALKLLLQVQKEQSKQEYAKRKAIKRNVTFAI